MKFFNLVNFRTILNYNELLCCWVAVETGENGLAKYKKISKIPDIFRNCLLYLYCSLIFASRIDTNLMNIICWAVEFKEMLYIQIYSSLN